MNARLRALKRLLMMPIIASMALVHIFLMIVMQGGICALVQLVTGYPLSDQFIANVKKQSILGDQ